MADTVNLTISSENEELDDNAPTSDSLSSYLNPFDKTGDVSDLYKDTNKYLGEDLYVLDGDVGENTTTTITNQIESGDNFFNPFMENEGESLSIPLSSSNIGKTAGSNMNNSDIVWQFVDNTLEGAFYKRFDEEIVLDEARMKLDVGNNEFRYPFINKGLSSNVFGWSGPSIDNTDLPVFLTETQKQYQDDIESSYWSTNNTLSSSNDIPLNQSNLVESGAYAHANIFKADQIEVRDTRDSVDYEVAFLYDFSHTEIPVMCGLNQIYFPLFRYDDAAKTFPFNIPRDQVEDRSLASVNLTKEMCGAVAGTAPETADRLYKNNGFCGSQIEGAWLEGIDIGTQAKDIYLSAGVSIFIDEYDFSLSAGYLSVGGSYVSAGGVISDSVELLLIEDYASPDPVNDSFEILKEDDVVTVVRTTISGSGVVEDEKAYSLSSNGFNILSFYDEGSLTSENVSTLYNGVLPVVKEFSGASRQTGVRFVAASGESNHFFWDYPELNLNEVINGYDHDEHCEYLKIDKYSSVLTPIVGEETNQWEHCNCKAVYYSPIGNGNLGLSGFDNIKEYSDIVYLDVGPEPFSFTTWVDDEGNDYRASDKFAVFKHSGVEPDLGYGIGFWQTLTGKDLVLEQGKGYVYRRASFGGCSDNKPPCFVINNCHCFDRGSSYVDTPQWIKMIQGDDGVWSTTGEPSDMLLQSGQYYEYDRVKSIGFTQYKDKQPHDRTSYMPAYSLNLKFDAPKPYWAETPTVGSLGTGLSAFEVNDYLLTTQPKPSPIILKSDDYVNYNRNACEPFIWSENLTFTVDFQKPDTWKVLDFGFKSPNLLRKIVGCGTCELVFNESPDSCFLKENNCESYIGVVTETDTDSTMVLRTPLDCGDTTDLFVSTSESFVWSQDFLVSTNEENNYIEYTQATTPWSYYLNGPNATLKYSEDPITFRTKDELGVFKPEFIGVNKIQCFKIEQE